MRGLENQRLEEEEDSHFYFFFLFHGLYYEYESIQIENQELTVDSR